MRVDTSKLRIISLLPSATEIIFALGAGGHVVGVTHECDFPSEADRRPRCTGSLLPHGLSAREIDNAVSVALTDDAHSIYRLDVPKVRQLKPTVIVTQSLCAVCAVPENTVKELSCTLPHDCHVVSSDPHTLDELFVSIVHIGKAICFESAAEQLVSGLKLRLANVRAIVPPVRPRVVVLEWPDPPYAPGHWVPDMIESAGGTCVLGESGAKSKRVEWQRLCELRPDVIICAFCGYNLKKNEEECDRVRIEDKWREFAGNAQIYSSNASAYFSRPGNRLIDGTELLAFLLHRVPQYKPEPGCASLRTGGEWNDVSDV